MDLIKHYAELIRNSDIHRLNDEELKVILKDFANKYHALQLSINGVSGFFSYKEALAFLELHTPIAVKPIKKSKYEFVQPFTSKNARDIVLSSLATELSKNNR